ncbi:hypothetical protein OTU49_011353 [Cherax quadricarinatus]|uniref:Serum response factor homolog n=1 Tax=Cherax quadricarinatus TaxID=27406 RepID=A0AAW0W4Z9_CHEQU|nr:serum response factor homolog [Cherax quadricarinatus]
MQNQSHNSVDDKFGMNFGAFDPELFSQPHMAAMGGMGIGMKRSAQDAGLDREPLGLSSDDDTDLLKKEDKMNPSSSRDTMLHHHTSLDNQQPQSKTLPNGKKTKGRVKIKMEFIDNKLRRYTTFSKRKTGIMKKAYELSTLTGTQVMLLVASETGHVYTFATRKLQPMITSEAGKALIQTCLNSPDPPQATHHHDQRMSATGFEETELTYAVTEDEHKVRQMMYSTPINSMHQGGSMASPSHHAAAAAAAAAAALQTHHHQPQYHHPHPPPTPHLTTPTSTHPMNHHHHHLTQTSPGHTGHTDHTGVGLHQHTHLVAPQTPLPSHSPLPPHSPMGAPSPTSPYTSLHHHPHHHIPAHSR